MSKPQITDDQVLDLLRQGIGKKRIKREYSIGTSRIMRLGQELARKGVAPDYGVNHEAAPGFVADGYSDFYNEETGQLTRRWMKYKADKKAQHQMMLDAIEGMAAELPKLPPRPAAAGNYREELMACYPIGDAHIGMLSWPDETGEAWDLEIAEQIQCGAMAELVERAPACRRATIINLGDWYHYDNMAGMTERSGHIVDRDGRFPKMAHVGVKVMRQCIESALDKHAEVHVINVKGNHDDTGATMLSICLAISYENEPRVTVDTSPEPAMYFRHGATFVGLHHGHSIKADRLPGVMANDRPQDWGETTHRYWWMGHIHHQSLKDYPGVTVESFRTLAAKDAYAAWGGYRSPRDMKCIVLHEEHGEVARHTVNPRMIDSRASA